MRMERDRRTRSERVRARPSNLVHFAIWHFVPAPLYPGFTLGLFAGRSAHHNIICGHLMGRLWLSPPKPMSRGLTCSFFSGPSSGPSHHGREPPSVAQAEPIGPQRCWEGSEPVGTTGRTVFDRSPTRCGHRRTWWISGGIGRSLGLIAAHQPTGDGPSSNGLLPRSDGLLPNSGIGMASNLIAGLHPWLEMTPLVGQEG